MSLPKGANYASDYGFMMRDAHRRPAQAVRPPAVSWHVGYLRPFQTGEKRWYEEIEDLILAVFDKCVQNVPKEPKDACTEISNLHDEPSRFTFDIKDYDQTINLLRNSYRYRKNSAHIDATQAALDRGRYETVVIGGKWLDHDYWIRFEVFDEFFNITVALQVPSSVNLDNSLDLQTRLDKNIGTISKHIDERFRQIYDEKTKGQARDVPKDVHIAATDCFSDIWDSFSKDILEPAFAHRPFCSHARRDHVPIALTAFVDFRGLILQVCETAETKQGDRLYPPLAIATKADATLSVPHDARIIGASKYLCSETPGSDDTISRWANSILPILLSQENKIGREHRQPPFEPAEYTFSTFVNRRYIYGSGFGPQVNQEPERSRDFSPLTYVVLAFHDEWREIGRTLLRIHTLGTLRMSALFELRKLMTRDEILLNLENELRDYDHVRTSLDLHKRHHTALTELAKILPNINVGSEYERRYRKSWVRIKKYARLSASESFHLVLTPYLSSMRWWRKKEVETAFKILKRTKRYIVENQSFDEEERKQKIDEIRAAIRQCHYYVDSDTREQFRGTVLFLVRKALAGMDRGIRNGGITYRASRSQYARERYDSLSDAMNIEQIRGYQPYNVFVRHRLDRAYGLIQGIDSRFRQISKIEMQHRNRLDSQKLVIHQKLLSSLQSTAEIAFFVILAPYYIGHVVEAIAEGWLNHVAFLEQQKVAISSTSKWFAEKITSHGDVHEAPKILGSFSALLVLALALLHIGKNYIRDFLEKHKTE